MNAVFLPEITPGAPDEKEILRYAGGGNEAVLPLLSECLGALLPRLSYRVCALECPVSLSGAEVDLGVCRVTSAALAGALAGFSRAVIFAATVGAEADRAVRAAAASPLKALLLDAVATERVEALCDAFQQSLGVTGRRRSPGYGDLPLTFQKDIFRVLNCEKHIGVTLCDSLLMTPAKSVTAVVGVKKEELP